MLLCPAKTAVMTITDDQIPESLYAVLVDTARTKVNTGSWHSLIVHQSSCIRACLKSNAPEAAKVCSNG